MSLPSSIAAVGSWLGLTVVLLAGLGREAAGAEPSAGEAEPGEVAEAKLVEPVDDDAASDDAATDDAARDEPVSDEPVSDEPVSDDLVSDDDLVSEEPGGAALPSGEAKTDDEPVDEEELEAARRGGRAGRRGARAERDAGQWQVFAPYPELGPIRYRDPENRRTLWLGVDVSATYLPASLGLSSTAVWSARPAGAWALALTPWLALGGRHELAWYDAEERRIRVHGHQVELSSRPLAASRSTDALDDRLAVGITSHAIQWSDDAGTISRPAGQQDTILHAGYGLDHLLGTRWRLGWQAQGRYAWVASETQRQARVSTRLAFHPRPAHRLSLDAVGYYVNRDAGVDPPRPRSSFYGQVGLGYAWVGSAGVGPWTRVRATSGFMSGEAPVYELRGESLAGGYGEVLVGMLARWP